MARMFVGLDELFIYLYILFSALLQITNNPHAQIAVLVDLVSERLKDKNWVVAFKTLIVSHNLMTLGHEVHTHTHTHTYTHTHTHTYIYTPEEVRQGHRTRGY